ncbi:MAG TPA: hypothetical protein VGI39_11355 [Polyangiaceae bacterium]|jgi:hypothetical protein
MIGSGTGRNQSKGFVCTVAALTIAACAPPAPAAAPSAPSAGAPAPDIAKTAYPKMAPLEEYLMDRDAELALARSAAPAPTSSVATVLALTKTGYEKVAEGTNGFVCMVERSWFSPFDDAEFWNPKERSPVCLNPPAARSALPVSIKITELALAGLTTEQILARMKALVAQKAFPAPEVGSMSYMMSKQQYLSDAIGHAHPHLMFYVPGDMDASVWGANLPGASAVYGGGTELPGGGRLPWTLFFVPVATWSDGTPFEARKRT